MWQKTRPLVTSLPTVIAVYAWHVYGSHDSNTQDLSHQHCEVCRNAASLMTNLAILLHWLVKSADCQQQRYFKHIFTSCQSCCLWKIKIFASKNHTRGINIMWWILLFLIASVVLTVNQFDHHSVCRTRLSQSDVQPAQAVVLWWAQKQIALAILNSMAARTAYALNIKWLTEYADWVAQIQKAHMCDDLRGTRSEGCITLTGSGRGCIRLSSSCRVRRKRITALWSKQRELTLVIWIVCVRDPYLLWADLRLATFRMP